MNMIARCLLIVCLVVGGYLGSPLSVNAKRGLKIGGEQTITDTQGKEVLLYKESHALVIGVSEYTEGWSDLPGVKKDIQAVKTALENNGFHVEVVENPKYGDLDNAFKTFINQYGQAPENRLLFYFSGHGHTMKLATGVEMGYIVPADTPNPHSNKQGFLAKALDMQMFESYAKRIQAKHALFIFDSCFSGSIFALSKAAPESITYKTASPVRQFITSGSADEQVPDESIFRQQFITALNGAGDMNKDEYVTGEELGYFLQDTVITYSKGTQHPQYGKIRDPILDQGDFVFQLPGSMYVKQTIITESPEAPSVVDPETAMWKLIEQSDNIQDVKDFLAAFPEGKFAKVAQLKLRQLERLTPTPLPTATPVPMPTVSQMEQQIAQLLEQADAYFARQWYTTPEETNAFDLYQDVLQLDPANTHAHQQIDKIAEFYKSRAEREERRGRTEQAILYWRKYLKIVPDEEAVLDKIAELQLPLPTVVPPTPTPIYIVVTPTPKPTRRPPTPTPRPPTPTPQPKPGIRLRSEPGTFSTDMIKKMVQTRGFRDSSWNPHGDFPNKFEAKTFKGDRVVIDHATGLMWQQAGSSNTMKWQKAQDYVDQLNRDQYAGFSDWRLPTIEELASLLEPEESSNGLFINPIFNKNQRWCWSADKSSSGSAWLVNFLIGDVNWNLVKDYYYVRVVRS